MKSVEADLQIIVVEIRGEAHLPSSIGGCVVVGRGRGVIVWIAIVIGRVAMKQRRGGEQKFWVEGVHPFTIHIAQTAAIKLRAFQIIEIRIERDERTSRELADDF